MVSKQANGGGKKLKYRYQWAKQRNTQEEVVDPPKLLICLFDFICLFYCILLFSETFNMLFYLCFFKVLMSYRKLFYYSKNL